MARSEEHDRGTTMGDGTDPGTAPEGDIAAGSDVDPLRPFLTRVFRISAVLAIVGTVAARVAGAQLLAVNFFIGSMIGMLMLYTTARLVRRYVTPSARIKRNRNRLILLLLAKFPLLGLVLYFVTSGDWFHPIGLLLGVSMMPFMLTLYGLILFMRQGAADERGDWTAVLNRPKRSYR